MQGLSVWTCVSSKGSVWRTVDIPREMLRNQQDAATEGRASALSGLRARTGAVVFQGDLQQDTKPNLPEADGKGCLDTELDAAPSAGTELDVINS